MTSPPPAPTHPSSATNRNNTSPLLLLPTTHPTASAQPSLPSSSFPSAQTLHSCSQHALFPAMPSQHSWWSLLCALRHTLPTPGCPTCSPYLDELLAKLLSLLHAKLNKGLAEQQWFVRAFHSITPFSLFKL